MKKFLLPHLICPSCLPKEQPLALSAGQEREGELVTGILSCAKCRRQYPIRDGIAQLLTEEAAAARGRWRYEDQDSVNRYLWSHYADLHGDRENQAALLAWAGLLAERSAGALEAGCSVGRISFEMAARSEWAVGCDLSESFVKTARQLAAQRQLTYSLPLEGNLRETFRFCLPESFRTDNLEFVVADALRLPFARGSCQQVVSLNVLDRVNHPLAHLVEMNRVAQPRDASFLIASPFSWTSSDIPEGLWLGGTVTGPYSGRGLENVRSLLEGKGRVLAPSWKIDCSLSVLWKLRSHGNHYDCFRSQTLSAAR